MSLSSLHKAAAAAATPLHNSVVPRLVVTKQTCVSSESSMRDGVSRQVFVVVKHSPFSICLALEQPIEALNTVPNRKTIGFNSGQLTARLLYDSEDEKEVDFVRMKPLEYKTRISDTGTGATVECRLKVLTSQLEDMLFRIKFTLLDADNNELSPLLVARSEPIKVISKPEQPRKQKTRTKKRTLNDMLLDTLSRIEKMQLLQQERLQQITQTVGDVGGVTTSSRLTGALHHHHAHTPLLSVGGPSSSSSLSALGGNVGFSSLSTTPSAVSSYADGHRNKKQKLIDDDRPLDFELAFRDLLDSFEALPPEQRFEQLRRFLESSGTSLDSLSELHDLFSSEGLERPIGSQVPRVGPTDEEAGTTFSADGELTCECQDCPHKLELERIEEFYKEVFSLG